MSCDPKLPILYVEGPSDISVISALLARHGVDTNRGLAHLCIHAVHNIDTLLANMPQVIKNSTSRPVGFALDIDIEIVDRWTAVRERLKTIGIEAPKKCPASGFFGQMTAYPHRFGVWLLPDCQTDGMKLEHLVASLVRDGDPGWTHAQESIKELTKLVDEANAAGAQWSRYRDVDRIKAEVHTLMASKDPPGAPLGAAITSCVLRDDSEQAIAFLRWLKDLYGLELLTLPA